MQAWLEELKFQQTIKHERKVSYREGARANAIENAKNLLRMNLGTADQIAQAVSLPLEEVLALKNES